MIWPQWNYVYISGINLNENDIAVTWHLVSRNRRAKIKSKTIVIKNVRKFTDENFLIFILFVVLGDGDVDVKEKTIRFTVGHIKYKQWNDIINRIKGLGFKDHDRRTAYTFKVKSSKAITLAQSWFNNLSIRTMIEDLSLLHDADKLRNLITLANTKARPKGKSMIEVAGIKMSIHINSCGSYIRLRTLRKKREDAVTIQERLRSAGFDARFRELKGKFEVYINQSEIRKHPEPPLAKVCGVLRRMIDEALNEGNKKRTQRILKAMKNLGCQ